MKKFLFPAALAAAFLLPAPLLAQDFGFSGLYSELRLGGSLLSDANNRSTSPPAGIDVQSEYDTGFAGEITVGRQTPYGLRYEFAIGYARYSIGDLTIVEDGGIGVNAGVGDLDGLTVAGDGHAAAFTYMIGAYYGFGDGALQPYIGAAVGGAYVSANISSGGVDVVDDDDNVFAYQGSAGLDYRVSDYITVGARYTYFATTDPTFSDALGVEFDSEIQSHNVLLTVRFFND